MGDASGRTDGGRSRARARRAGAILLALGLAAIQSAPLALARPRSMTDDEARGLAAVGWFGPGPAPHAAGGGCTAVLVAPDMVLTAAHCLTPVEGRPPDHPRAFVFAPGWPNAGGGKRFRVEQVWLAAARTLLGGALPYDLALARLARAVPDGVARPLPFWDPAADAPEPGAEGAGGADGMAAAAALPATLATLGYPHEAPDTPVLNDDCPVVAAEGPVLGLGCRARGGFSGGPVLVPQGDGWALLAITVARGTRATGSDAPAPAIGLYAVAPAPDLLARLPRP